MLVRMTEDKVIGHRLWLAGELVVVDDRVAALMGLAPAVTEVTGPEIDEVIPFTDGFDPAPAEAAAVPVAVKKQRKGGK
jgi:hypothetical protein